MAAKTKRKKPGSKKSSLAAPAGEVLTLPEAAAFLRLAEPVVQRLAIGGRLPGRDAEGDWRFSRVALLGWLAGSDPAAGPVRPRAGEFVSDETPEEQEAFLALLRAQRDEIDRATGSGKYAPE